jgi:Fe-S-cluster containining protein
MEWKCCTYRPFIANFLVGAVADSSAINAELMKEWDFLIVGLTPNLSYRKYFAKKGKWGFGTDATLLCSFYNKNDGGCRIWQARPAVCRTFFCKSSYAEDGSLFWKKAEEFTWILEWVLLEDFLHSKGWSLEEVGQIKEFLNEDRLPAHKQLPKEFYLPSIEAARIFYKEAAQYIEQRSQNEVLELLGTQGNQIYQELLAHKAKLR